MADLLRTEVLKIIIDAQNRTAAGLASASRDVEGFRATLASAGRAALIAGAGMGGALAAGLAATVGPAAQFQQTMAGVQAVSGATATQMQQLSDLALRLGKDTVFSASQAGQGIEALVKGGVSVQDIMSGAAQATLNLAAAGGVDLATASEIAANAANIFAINGAQMAHVADMIAGAANASSLDVTDFRYSMASAGAVAKTIGLSFDDLAVAISEMGAAGIRGMDAGTSLKMMFLELNPKSKQAADEMRRLGIITSTGSDLFFDAAGHVRRLADVQEVLQRATAGLTDQQRLAALNVMFGSDAIRAASILANDGADGFNKMAAAMGNVTAASVAGTRMGTFMGQLEQFKGSVETLQIAIGMALLPSLTDLVGLVTGAVNGMLTWAQAHEQLLRTVLPVAAALAGLASVMLAVSGGVALLVFTFSPLALAVTAVALGAAALAIAWQTNWHGLRPLIEGVARLVLVLGASYGLFRLVTLAVTAYRVANELLVLAILAVRIGMVQETLAAVAARVALVAGTIATVAITAASWLFAGAMAVVKDGTILWTGAQWLLNVALDANPLGLVILGVAALTAGIIWAYQNVGWFRGLLNGLWSFISGTLLSGIGTLAHFLGDVLGGAINFAYNALRGFLELLSHIPGVSIHLPAISSVHLTAGSGGVGAGATGTGGAFRAGLGSAPVLAAVGGGASPFAGATGGSFLAAQAAAAQAAASRGGSIGGAGGSVPGISGMGGGSGPSTQINITVEVGAGAVSVSGDTGKGGGLRDYGVRVGEAIADAIAEFARAEQSVSAGANVLLPGARG